MNLKSKSAVVIAFLGVAVVSPAQAAENVRLRGTIVSLDGPTLTVKNFDVWCSVSVNGGAASTDAVQTVPITTPTDVALVATPASSTFILGDWHHTDGDTGSGDPGTVSGTMSTAKVNVGTSNVCVWVCCPFANPPGTGCPTTDQCP